MKQVVIVLLCLVCCSWQVAASERNATPPSSVRVRPGFRVELLRSAQEGESSWISMTFDPQGRVIVGLDDCGLARLTLNSERTSAEFERLPGTETLLHSRGVLYAHGALYVCATNSQGLYRLKDPHGNGQYEPVELLKAMPYESRYGHGTNQIVAGPDGMLYIVNGNDVTMPTGVDPRSPYRKPQNDWLLTNPSDEGQDDRVGHILRTDPEGKEWTVIAGGLRNQFDIAFNEHGEMFTWDADMEWDIGLPWYRPTRINHLIPGGEYGWRWGTGKWPAWYPDSLPTTLDTGYSSPTGLLFGHESNWPERFRKALYMADWQNGRVLLVDLIPQGATYSAQYELFLEGGPLNVCDMVFGPDGAMYFITGGRGSQSGLYRVSVDPEHPVTSSIPSALTAAQEAEAAQARKIRKQLELLQVQQAPESLDFLWEQLGSPDEWLRFSARVALENQSLDLWRPRVVSAENSLAKNMALLALSRVGGPEDQKIILSSINAQELTTQSVEELLLTLRTLQLSFIRQGKPDQAAQQQLLQQLDSLYPHDSFPVNWLLGELLVVLEAPQTRERTLSLLERAATQEEQVQYAKTLLRLEAEWSRESAQKMLGWLYRTRKLPGGKLMETTLVNLRTEFESQLSDELKGQLVVEFERLKEPILEDVDPSLPNRPFVKRWTMEELLEDVASLKSEDYTVEQGRGALAAAVCLRCHRVGDRGAQVGPDLTYVGKRFDGRALLESILHPEKEVDPKYQYVTYLLTDGRVITGRPVGINRNHITVEVDPLTAKIIPVAREQIEESFPAQSSPMPGGLLDTLQREEILALIALLRR